MISSEGVWGRSSIDDAISSSLIISDPAMVLIGICFTSSNDSKLSWDFIKICDEPEVLIPIGFLLSNELRTLAISVKVKSSKESFWLSIEIMTSSLAAP